MKLKDIDSTKDIVPTSAPGVYIKNISLERIENMVSMFDDMREDDDADNAEVVLTMFKEIIRDENGEEFEDAQTIDDIRTMGVMTINEINSAVKEKLADTGKL